MRSDLSLNLTPREKYSEDWGLRYYYLSTDIASDDIEECRTAYRHAQQWMIPLPDNEILQLLTTLFSVTNKGNVNSQDDITLRIQSMLELAREIPGDILIRSIRELINKQKWWVSWSEIYEECKNHDLEERNTLINALHKRIKELDNHPKLVHNNSNSEEL